MATKKTVVSELASALGTAAARVENLKPKRTPNAKHTKAQPVQAASVAAGTPVAEPAVPRLTEREEVELVAYLYSEQRGFQGGSPDEDWVRAEQEVRRRRSTRN